MKKAFTLIEILIAIAIVGLIMVTMGAVLGMSFRAKETTVTSEALKGKSNFVFGKMRDLVFNAKKDTISCPSASQLVFDGKDGGRTTISCIPPLQIASASAEGTYNYLSDGIVTVVSCNFYCPASAGVVYRVGVTLALGTTGPQGGIVNETFYESFAPRD